MAEKVKTTGVTKESGFLYYLDKNGNVSRTKMARGANKGGNAEVVANAGVNRESGWLYFIDKDGDEQKIIFHGTKPQDFERSEQITLQGKMVDGTFICTKILMKCPSKYNDGKEEVEIRSIES